MQAVSTVLPCQLSHEVSSAEGSVDLHAHFTLAQCTLVYSICHRCTDAFALAQVVPQNRVAFDCVCVWCVSVCWCGGVVVWCGVVWCGVCVCVCVVGCWLLDVGNGVGRGWCVAVSVSCVFGVGVCVEVSASVPQALHGKRPGCSFIGPADLDAPWTVKIDRSTGKRMGLAVRLGLRTCCLRDHALRWWWVKGRYVVENVS